MNDPAALDCLQQALLLSHRILELAEAQQWQEMEKLDRQRMDWLKKGFDQGFTHQETAQARVLTEQIQALNQQAMHKAGQALVQVKESARSMQRNLQAARAYLENTEQGQQATQPHKG